MQTITVLVRDNHNSNGISYPDPLLYAVQVNDPKDAREVYLSVAIERASDIGCAPSDLDLDLLCAFAGDVNTIADWRE